MRSVKVVGLALVASMLLSASLAWSQGGNPPASTKESGETSGHGMTAAEQSGESGGTVEKQIKALHEQSRQAALKGDTSFQEKYLANDYVGIGGDGSMLTKDQAIQMLKSGAIKYESIDEHDVKVRVYDGTAIINAMATLKMTAKGTPISGDFHATFVWVKQSGKLEGSIVSGNASGYSEPVETSLQKSSSASIRRIASS